MTSVVQKAFFDEMQKLSYAREFVAGVDPFGFWTSRLGQEAERRGTSEADHRARQVVGTVGGLAGGGLLIPSAISGVIGGVGGISGGAKGMARGAVEGFKKPVQGLLSLHRTRGLVNRAYESSKAIPTKVELDAMKNLMGEVPVGELAGVAKDKAVSSAPKLRKAQQVINKLQRGGNVPVTANRAKELDEALSVPTRKILSGIGMGAGVGGLGAYAQYGKGRQMEQEFQQRLEQEFQQRLKAGE